MYGEQVLDSITKTHPAPDTTLEVGCRTGEAEVIMRTVLVPDVHHPVSFSSPVFTRKLPND